MTKKEKRNKKIKKKRKPFTKDSIISIFNECRQTDGRTDALWAEMAPK